MRCRCCQQPAGWFRRSCATCDRLLAIVTDNRGLGLSQILDLLIATGATREHIEAFLAADNRGGGTVRDGIIADVTNELMGALGQTGQQSVNEVKRLRERGLWVSYGERPRTE